ncbi:hypothetical protein [Aerococcus urinaeequi]|uniref:hypothetical protein n=1 Tax=Aerococcus urinaeequi TaxID=51665 RepID=UPI002891FC57|nr:hypothetical protein [Aerococcus urinaeequi]MDT2761042.1 hypothetical protein [Aerococcus urinaeequi]
MSFEQNISKLLDKYDLKAADKSQLAKELNNLFTYQLPKDREFVNNLLMTMVKHRKLAERGLAGY